MEKPTEKTAAHKRVIELNDELENYFSNTIIPQLFVDADLIVRKFTPAAMSHFKLSEDDLGRHVSDVANNIRFPTILENIQEVITNKQGIVKDIQTTDKVWYQMNILPYIIRKENRTNGVIITFVDINDRIKILNGYERLNRSYENIIHSISHDIKGPLSNIDGLVNVLREKQDNEEEKTKILDMLSKSVAHLRKTINDLADIKESDTDFAKGEELLNFENIVEDAKLALKGKIAETDAQIETDIGVTQVKLSRRNIRSILYNLLSNAIKYNSAAPPKILIRTWKSGDKIVLAITDNGIGIPPDKRETIFERNTRVNTHVEGTGMGLFIVKRMVEDMDGSIEVDSEVGKGSTFTIYFRNQ
ncbi:PAS domain-containing protein [Pontibacter sp. Tf4]|uniref:sensor histidine kinase n=1 Tax=Pontibacter sp. Tf4 TaxID=2761620 RepID=UPI00162A5598|nr:ATP-binding protein [Pontibacter sp. Tf4]MBB6612381.1 PAS domain-containing protein [Pontibacter sp. Tf4]